MTEHVRTELLEETVKVMDLFYQVNAFKPTEERLDDKEFFNEALNTSADLKLQFL